MVSAAAKKRNSTGQIAFGILLEPHGWTLAAPARITGGLSGTASGKAAIITWYNDCMPSFAVETPQRRYPILVERGCLARLDEHIPARAGKVFFVTTEDVWKLHGHWL